MSTMHHSRQFIVREGREAVLSACSEREREKEGEGPKAVRHELYRGTARALVSGKCPIAWLVCFLAMLVPYLCFPAHSRGSYIFEMFLVLIFLVISAFLMAMKRECDRRELMHRVMEIIDIYGAQLSTCASYSKGGERENVEGTKNEQSGIKLGSTWASIVLSYRDETWQRLPEVLLIEGDIIALICGDIAPGRLRPLTWSKIKNDWIDIDVEIPKGKEILQEWSGEGFNLQNTRFLQETSPELLRLFGDVKCYRMQDTPLLDYLTNTMNESDLKREQAMRTLLRDRLSVMFNFTLYLAGICALLTIVAGAFRLGFQYGSESSEWLCYFLYYPAISALCFLPLPAPIFLALGEALMTAHLLLYFGEPMKNPSVYTTSRRTSRCMAQTGSTSPPLQRAPSVHAMQPPEYDELDVRERITARQKMHSALSMKRELYQTWRVLRTWVSRSLNRKAPTPAAQSDDVSSAKNRRMAMPVPLRRTCLVDRLGSVSSFCVLDEEVVCKPCSTVEEVFILNNHVKRTDALTTIPRDFSTAYSVLNLHTGEDLDSNSAFIGSKFDDAQWWTRLSSLKPIGFTCLVAEGQGAARLGSNFHPTNCEPDLRSLPKQPHVCESPEAKLIECSRRLPSYRALLDLSKEMGFTEHNDMSNYCRVHKIGIMYPRLDARSTEGANPRAVGQHESWARGIFNPHAHSYVILDKRIGSLHCMSEGSPPLLLGMCSDYWDGTSISAIPAKLRSLTIEAYTKWTKEDFDVTAFSCAPVPYTLEDLLCGRGVIRPPDYLVYPKNAPISPVGRKQSGVSRPAIVTPYCLTSPEASHEHHERIVGYTSPLCFKKSQHSSTNLPKPYHSDENLNRMHGRAIQEATRASSLRLHENLYETLHRQVFLGMVASSSCPAKSIPGLIEHLLALGVRFLYFSPRNMRRTKAIAEKMGMFTDWNCAISLRALDMPNIPDPDRMTSMCDWDVNARLPHGTEAIREHIKEVDNVPLLVPLFTDSTPETILEMIDILKEYHETVLCVGTGYRLASATAFEMADLTVVREALPAGQEDSTLPLYSERRLSLLDMQFCQDILGVYAALPMRASPPTEQMDDRVSNLGDAIYEGSRVLHNIYQALVFVAISSSSLGLIPLISLMYPTTVPMLLTPRRRMPEKLPEKHSPGILQNSIRYIVQVLICALLQSFGVIVHGIFMFGELLNIEDSTVAQQCAGRQEWPHFSPLLCPEWLDDLDRPSVVKSRVAALHEMLNLLVLGWIFCSGFLHYRVSSPFQIPPWRNRVWVVAVCITVCIHAVYFFLVGATRGILSLMLERVAPIQNFLFAVVWLFIICGMIEIFRIINAKGYNRSQTLLRLEFDTRLGMHSPR